MLIFLSVIITLISSICYFKILPFMNKEFFRKKVKFNTIMSKSDFDEVIYKSDLLLFRHEFGETIFELQKEMNSLREEVNSLKSDSTKKV